MSSRAAKSKKGASKKKVQRATSNVFAMFDQTQIHEFKEAFNVIDQDRDGIISAKDLTDMFNSLGRPQKEDYIEDMLGEATGAVNFTMFMTLFSENMHGTDPEDMIKSAFTTFDPNGSGIINEDRMRPLLMKLGDRFTEEECDEMFTHANVDDDGNLNYNEFTKIIKHGEKDD
ncbi:myosin regulatory light polypeptide 9-like [Stylophora pistillata]|uniref:Myosin regulatory light chain sqh n=1 Tax=Stylophora pistillata TaxID=50429 RepID=A0A2B4SUZ6_STYPI|nr:myosin regulatory light polypeptide 9-like [Stylophora pistillata]PFX32362.1 Myosin regulatory light chain sqh [Stylophora pistillata]